MYKTTNNTDTSKTLWKVSFNIVQKELTSEQKQIVKEVNS